MKCSDDQIDQPVMDLLLAQNPLMRNEIAGHHRPYMLKSVKLGFAVETSAKFRVTHGELPAKREEKAKYQVAVLATVLHTPQSPSQRICVGRLNPLMCLVQVAHWGEDSKSMTLQGTPSFPQAERRTVITISHRRHNLL